MNIRGRPADLEQVRGAGGRSSGEPHSILPLVLLLTVAPGTNRAKILINSGLISILAVKHQLSQQFSRN
jgi:hypothetical protein